MLTYDMGPIKLNQRGLYATLNSQRSPVANYIRELGRKTTVTAKLLAGVRTGQLKRSIKMTRDRSVINEYAVLVGSDVRHALVHHQGARPHVITARNPTGMLVFRGKRGMVFTSKVNHPGHGANKYLTRALQIAVRR